MLRILTVLILVLAAPFARAESEVRLKVLDEAGDSLPCRIHVTDEAGKPVFADGLPLWKDHFVCDGSAKLNVPGGKYSYVVERGKEYFPAKGSFTVDGEDEATISISLRRGIDMAKRGWWSGELHVHRAVEEIPLHLRAEDLHIAPVITWWNGRDLWKSRSIPTETRTKVDGNRFFDVMAGEDEREGGALMYYGLKKPLALPGGKGEFPEHPSPMKFVEQAREQKGAWIDLEKPFWWDTPVWLASGQINSIGLANNHMCRSQMYESEAWGKPRDTKRLPSPRGNGLWTQEIYYHILNSGLRYPPSAGSASGVLPNPVGYNRVYVHTGGDLSWDAWWKGLKRGRSFVTNGPLLICKANEKFPGGRFTSDAGETTQIELDIVLFTLDSVPTIEVIWNGEVVKSIPVAGRQEAGFRATIEVDGPGWFLVRAITDKEETFRFASTAPWFVNEFGSPRRISRKSAEFFADWVDERIERVQLKLKDPTKLREVLEYHEKARVFWRQRVAAANAP